MEPNLQHPANKRDASVVVSTNGDVARVQFALEALSRQSTQPVSVHVIDDGSRGETLAVCDAWRPLVSFELTHTWDPDRSKSSGAPGRRVVSESQGSELLFLNANCIPHSRWTEDHLTAAARSDVRCGRRVRLGPELTERVLAGVPKPHELESPFGPTFKAALTGDTQKFARALRLPRIVTRLIHRHPRRLKAFNFSVSRHAFEAVNGFDLNWCGRRDDRELEVRLQDAGFKFTPLINRAIAYSLFRANPVRLRQHAFEPLPASPDGRALSPLLSAEAKTS